jgi:hypothetical protein
MDGAHKAVCECSNARGRHVCASGAGRGGGRAIPDTVDTVLYTTRVHVAIGQSNAADASRYVRPTFRPIPLPFTFRTSRIQV